MNGVADNANRSRFELIEQSEVAFADYSIADGQLTIPYVEVPPALRGTGSAGRLMEGVVVHAQERRLKIVPICGYAVAWFQRHPEHQSALA
jgi:predicted GNAT family acetyltransferase